MYFYNRTTRQYILAIAKIFSDLYVKREEDGTVIREIKVPLIYATKNRFTYKSTMQSNTNEVSIILPLIGYNLIGFNYNPDRKQNSLNEIIIDGNSYVYEAVPYDFNFEVYLKTKYLDDMYQLLEQILYFFKPDISMNIIEVPELNITRDVLIKLEDVSLNFETELDEENERSFESQLSLTLHGAIYPPVRDGKLILDIYANMRNFNTEKIDAIIHISGTDPLHPINTEITEYPLGNISD